MSRLKNIYGAIRRKSYNFGFCNQISVDITLS